MSHNRIHQQLALPAKALDYDYTKFKPALIYKAVRPDAPPIYLFGTLHWLVDVDIVDLYATVFDDLIQQVDIVYTEVIAEDDQVLTEQYALDDNKLFLPDIALMNKARATHKSQALETIAELRAQTRYDLNPAGKADFFDIIVNSLDRFISDTKDFMHNRIDLQWHKNSNGNIKDLQARNMRWLHKLLTSNALQQQLLVVCGINHLIDKFGLLNLLHQQGYVITTHLSLHKDDKKFLNLNIFDKSLFKLHSAPDNPECAIQELLFLHDLAP